MTDIPKAADLLAATEEARALGAKQLREAVDRVYEDVRPRLLGAMGQAAAAGKDRAGWTLTTKRHRSSLAENRAAAEKLAAELRAAGYTATIYGSATITIHVCWENEE